MNRTKKKQTDDTTTNMTVKMDAPARAPRVTVSKTEGAGAASTATPPAKKRGRQAASARPTAAADESVTVPELKLRRMVVKIKGTTSVIVHAWDEKAKEMMRNKQQGIATMKKQPKDPKALVEGCKYRDVKGRDCLLALGFKNAIVSASRFVEGLPMTVLRGALFVEGTTKSPKGDDLLPLRFKHCIAREDMVRVGQGTSDMRYRPEYQDWGVDLPIVFNTAVLTAAQVINLIRVAGFSVGVFEWRPEKNGQNGRFDVEDSAALLAAKA